MDVLYVAYDPEKLRQIIVNLLSNALKFTPEKGNIYITISNNVLAGDETNIQLFIKVKDTGIGIPEDQLYTIFERFYQLDNTHTRSAEGTGIGLSLTKELVKLMQGEITVKSPPSGATKGSEFIVMLPMLKVIAGEEHVTYTLSPENIYTETEEAVTTKTLFSEENQTTQKPLLLLVEDNSDVVAYIASCLSDYRIAVGKDGREGIEIAKEVIPDLIITDVMMPFVDGFELVRRLRTDEHTSHIPIIMLTAKADIESKMEGLLQGVDAYLEKPFHKEELQMRVKKLLEQRKNLQQYYLRKAGINKTITVDTIIEDAIAMNKVEDAFVKKVREAIEQNLTNAEFTVERLCKLIFMSHSQLHRKLDALTGCSPNKFIRIIRLNNAKEMLKKQESSISSVAFNCGYNDPGYFTRVFKQEFGVTPQEWRGNNNLVS
jgi:DNA-binding response OmpR family regulator